MDIDIESNQQVMIYDYNNQEMLNHQTIPIIHSKLSRIIKMEFNVLQLLAT